MPGASLALFADLGACHVQKSSVTICVLPTPSGWRATETLPPDKLEALFLSTPSGWRATQCVKRLTICSLYFYPRPPGGGRPRGSPGVSRRSNFYPRPPGGGRHSALQPQCTFMVFLSTPSGWRATRAPVPAFTTFPRFLSTPSGWRATPAAALGCLPTGISIHALRVEGDQTGSKNLSPVRFISIHALRVEGDILRATHCWCLLMISIHALRVEGDFATKWAYRKRVKFLSTPSGWRATARTQRVRRIFCISIHALRVEGDAANRRRVRRRNDFYPRPPGGGRLSTGFCYLSKPPISIHALRVEGDRALADIIMDEMQFLSTPSGWRATKACEKINSLFNLFLSTPSGWRATVSNKSLTPCKPNFYPRPPGGGRPCSVQLRLFFRHFYPRPPGGGRPT